MNENDSPDQSTQSPQDGTAAPAGGSAGDDHTMAMLAHLLAIFTWILGPLIVWLIKKDTSEFVDDQGKEAVNFQITIGIAYVAAGVLTCATLGLGAPIMGVLGLVNLIFCIIACLAANKGERYRYPICIRLIK